MNVAHVIMMCLGLNSAISPDPICLLIKTHRQLQLYKPGDKCHSQTFNLQTLQKEISRLLGNRKEQNYNI